MAVLRRLFPVAGLMVLAVLPFNTLARQYQSEQRIVPDSAAETNQPSDPQKLLEQLEDNPYATALTLRQFAGQAFKEKNYQQAAEYLQRAMKTNALSGHAQDDMARMLVKLYIANAQHDKVIEVLGPQLANNKNPDPQLLLALGNSYAQLKRPKEAIKPVQQAIKLSKKPEPAWYRLLLAVQISAKDFRGALATVQTVIRNGSRDPDMWLQLANLHLQLKQKESALAVLELAHRQGLLSQQDDMIRFAQLFILRGAPHEAGTLLAGLIAGGRLENSPDNQSLLARAWIEAREPQRALGPLSKVAKASRDPRTWLQLAQIANDLGQWDTAARALDAALKLGKLGDNTGPAWLSLGIAEYQRGNENEAQRAFEVASQHQSVAELAQQWQTYLQSSSAMQDAIRGAQRRVADQQEGTGRFGDLPELASYDEQGGNYLPQVDQGPAFTPVGANARTSRDGRIPAWQGGFAPDSAPTNYKPGGRLVDPWPDDKPVTEITAANMAEHEAWLTDGHKQLLRRYPSYSMPIYKTRRSAWYPEALLKATEANAETAKLLGPDALADARLGFPFPKPENGVQIMWNHRLRYRGDSAETMSAQAVVEKDGGYRLGRQSYKLLFRYGNLADPADLSKENVVVYLLTFLSESGRPGPNTTTVLVHETANSLKDKRNIWVLPAGFRRLLRIPPVDYDQPLPASGGMMFVDQLDMYNGAFDRYEWKLVGKRDLYIPYNAHRWNDGEREYKNMLGPGHPDPELSRYELHRVWVIEATERLSRKHKFGKRIFYIDEDSWNVALVENYQRDDKRIWRFQEGHLMQFYPWGFMTVAPMINYDFSSGRYFINRLSNEEIEPFQINVPDIKRKHFSPISVSNRYKF